MTKLLTLSLCLLGIITFWCHQLGAADKSSKPTPYQTPGAPAEPKVSPRWNRYHDVPQAGALLKQIAAAYPRYAKLQSLGKSFGGNEMWVLTITDFDHGKADEKPAFWLDGGIHANEIQTVEVVLYTAWYLTEWAGKHPWIDRLLKERTFYMMPMMSPDSRQAHFYQPSSTHGPRTGLRPVDDDRDGLFDEDGPDDLDGDGHITMMRVKDPNGRFKPHPDYPNLLIEAKPGEKGMYRLLGDEGFDNDGDGEVNEDGPGFYDPNRDWPSNWQPPYLQGGAYRYPFSILENRMVGDFIATRPNIAGAQSYHNCGGMLLRGPGVPTQEYDGADVRTYDRLAEIGERMLPGYKKRRVGTELYPASGLEIDWLFQMRGAYAFTNELFTPFNFFRDPGEQGFFAKDETLQRFDKYVLLNEGSVPWHEVTHPQYGKIEVGGIKKSWGRQPPSFLLEEECHRNMAFSLFHADQMPLVSVQSVDVKRLSDKLTQVTAIIENDRICPTRAIFDVKHKLTSPDVVRLSGKHIRVVVGMTDNDPYFQKPDEQKREPESLQIQSVPGNGVVYCRWLVEGNGPYEVSVTSVKGGRDAKRTQ
ncbi:MAG: peptidase M14 [Planctomycetes bacterium]|nr:peptidase M14 [Planctomycetota bacterium]